MGKLWLVLPILFLFGCAGMPCKKSPLIEVDNREQVKDCRLLRTFVGRAGEFIYGTPYMGNFKDDAMEEAEKMGATHILYRAELIGGGIEYTNVVYAYKCPENYELFRDEDEEY
jgi:hypothetical protein